VVEREAPRPGLERIVVADAVAPEVEFLIGFARVGHDAGYTTADLEERLLSLADRLGIVGAQVSATPTLVDVSLGFIPLQTTFTLRVQPSSVDLDAIARLDDVARDVLDGRTDARAALARLAEIESHPLRRRWFTRVAAYGLAGASVTPVLGGGWRELVAGAPRIAEDVYFWARPSAA